MKEFELTVTSDKKFEDVVTGMEQESAAKGFRVLHIHDVAATLAEKGFRREPLKIVEICNARYASQVLARDVKTSFMLPCPISVYVEEGKLTSARCCRPRSPSSSRTPGSRNSPGRLSRPSWRSSSRPGSPGA